MQGYFPITDGWDQPIDEMINLDRLPGYYDKTIEISKDVADFVDPEYALLSGMAHGFDMTKYEKAEADGEKYDLVSLWADALETDESGNYIIDNIKDAAVAIAYLAFKSGISSPSPLGAYNQADAVIKLS